MPEARSSTPPPAIRSAKSEENLGRLLAGRRDEFSVATKFAIGGPDGTGVLQTGNGRRAMFRSVEASLRRLDTDYIDLLWVHFPDFVTPLDEIVRGLDDLASSGKILYAGLSNFPAWMTSRAVTLAELRGAIPISGVQLEYSLVERSADRENLPMAESLGLGTALWSPLGGGLLSGKYRSSSDGRLTDWNRLCIPRTNPSRRRPSTRCSRLADEIGVPAAQVAVAWLIERARRSTTALVPVIGPRTVEQAGSRTSRRSTSAWTRSSTSASIRSAASPWGRRTTNSRRSRLPRLVATQRFSRPRGCHAAEPLRQQGFEGDAIAAVQSADHLDRLAFGVERAAVQQQHRHGRRRLEQRGLPR